MRIQVAHPSPIHPQKNQVRPHSRDYWLTQCSTTGAGLVRMAALDGGLCNCFLGTERLQMSDTFVARRRRFPMWVIHTNVSPGKLMKKVFNNGGMFFLSCFFCCTPFSGEFVSLPPRQQNRHDCLLIVGDSDVIICDVCAQQLFSLEGVW